MFWNLIIKKWKIMNHLVHVVCVSGIDADCMYLVGKLHNMTCWHIPNKYGLGFVMGFRMLSSLYIKGFKKPELEILANIIYCLIPTVKKNTVLKIFSNDKICSSQNSAKQRMFIKLNEPASVLCLVDSCRQTTGSDEALQDQEARQQGLWRLYVC